MFKVISFFVCLFLLFSCEVKETNFYTKKLSDGCEYICIGDQIATHKGTCNNDIHKCNAVVIHDTIYVAVK